MCRGPCKVSKLLSLKNHAYVFLPRVPWMSDSGRGTKLFVRLITIPWLEKIRRWKNSEPVVRIYRIWIPSVGFQCCKTWLYRILRRIGLSEILECLVAYNYRRLLFTWAWRLSSCSGVCPTCFCIAKVCFWNKTSGWRVFDWEVKIIF